MRFVCWLWRGRGFWKQTAKYDSRHVHVLASMLKRHGNHFLTCVHDGSFKANGNDEIGTVHMPAEVARLPDYLPKLWVWSREFQEYIGERFACIDLDVVILGDLAPLLQTGEPVKFASGAHREPYNTSLFVIEPLFGQEIWDKLDLVEIERAKRTAAYWTGDQSWVAHVLGPGYPIIEEDEGVRIYRPARNRDKAMPSPTLAAFMCGPYSPDIEARHSKWVRDAWR